jgi:hypothetical protein
MRTNRVKGICNSFLSPELNLMEGLYHWLFLARLRTYKIIIPTNHCIQTNDLVPSFSEFRISDLKGTFGGITSSIIKAVSPSRTMEKKNTQH